MLDLGLLRLKDPKAAEQRHRPDSELIVEWRALTIALLDRLAEGIRRRLSRTPVTFPLACVLEGGTWSAGRRAAREKRADGGSPLMIDSDGTVF
jgi:hypothetical protein